jgi:gamma-glutamylcyclotransferase (GGCT)/AIG2-like uncharacterized protein YtfP
MLYFAYCTLLDVDEMRRYCPSAVPTVVARLPGYRVGFARYSRGDSGGGCNLEEAPGEELVGLLYEMSPAAIETLDSIAGVDKGYYRKIDISVVGDDAQEIPAITYVIPEPGGPFQPSADYTRPILAGARALQLPPAYIRKLENIVRSAQAPET